MLLKQNKSGDIRITDITINDISNILKCQIELTINAVSSINNEILDYMNVGKRSANNGTRTLVISTKTNETPQLLNYSQVNNLIKKLYNSGILEIIIPKHIYDKKQELIDIFPDIKKEIIDEAIFIDWNEGMFSCISKANNNGPNEFHIWPADGTIYVFGKDVIFGNVEFEQFVCN